jgi:hypothetical protein
MRTIIKDQDVHTQYLRLEEDGKILAQDNYPTKHAFVINAPTQFEETVNKAGITLTAEEKAQITSYVDTVRQEIGE